MSRWFARLPLVLFVFALVLTAHLWGLIAGMTKMFPHDQFVSALVVAFELLGDDVDQWMYPADPGTPGLAGARGRAHGGLNLITRLGDDRTLFAEVRDLDGRLINQWTIDWFTLWPDATHVPTQFVPQARPGTYIHGAVVTRAGELIFNFEYLGLLKLDVDGNVVWRLAYPTHHSLHWNDRGNLWVCGLRVWRERREQYPNIEPGVRESMLLEVSPDGEILQELSVFDLLRQNDLNGLLYMTATEELGWQPLTLEDDALHLNDIEEFPSALAPGVFEPGDVMISLRNISTVLVFSTPGWRVKFVRTGMLLHQHDPDFIDGDTISVYDNNRRILPDGGGRSRIVLLDGRTGAYRVHYEGTDEAPFYSSIMGKHQWLPNGNLLITEAMAGRAFEIDPNGTLVWEYRNRLQDGRLGIVGEVTRIPLDLRAAFADASAM